MDVKFVDPLEDYTKSARESFVELAIVQASADMLDWKIGVLKQIPEGWHEVEKTHKTTPYKTRMTIRVDADVAKFFRAQGRGFQTRMNAVLRMFMLAKKAGQF